MKLRRIFLAIARGTFFTGTFRLFAVRKLLFFIHLNNLHYLLFKFNHINDPGRGVILDAIRSLGPFQYSTDCMSYTALESEIGKDEQCTKITPREDSSTGAIPDAESADKSQNR